MLERILENLVRDFQLTLQGSTPPIYMQLMVLAAIYILVKTYFLYRQKVRRAKVPPPQLVTNIFLLLSIGVVLGVVEMAINIYRTYIKQIIYVLF